MTKADNCPVKAKQSLYEPKKCLKLNFKVLAMFNQNKMIMKKIYITFNVPMFFAPTKRIAVECDNEDQARGVGQDVYAYDGTKYIRMRKCGKPHNREIVSYEDWWHYKGW